MRKPLNKKGQFTIIASLLVSIVLVTAIITTYSIIRNNPTQARPQILGAIDEMNLAVDRVLEFVVGYYGSILQVTGNTTYAKSLASDYLRSSLGNIALTHPQWSPSFTVSYSRVSASWFNRTSSSEGVLNITYSLMKLGIENVHYATSAGLTVTVNPSSTNSVLVNLTCDNEDPCATLTHNNFFLYNYSYAESAWELSNTGLLINSVTSTNSSSAYNITLPSGIDPSSYMLQAIDNRGIMVAASTFSHYTYMLDWNADGMASIYDALTRDTLTVEALQNGSLRWLGQNLQLTTTGKPIPPIPVKAFHINQTVDGVSHEVPFQVEDWGSTYRVPTGLTSNASVFGNRQMFVFLVNHDVENAVLWWDGRDIANQTSYAWENRYFNDNPAADPNYGVLNNGIVRLRVYNFRIESTVVGGTTTSTARFMRVNGEDPTYGAKPAYVIYNGVVRDIVQQEAEWSGGVAGSPNMYSQIVLTLPANATYYTYALRFLFVDSLQPRTVTGLRALQLSVSTGQPRTENGTSGGYPVSSSATGLFYNFTGSSSGWAHHWSEFISGSSGAGIMFTDSGNQGLYIFDSIAGQKTGALNIVTSGGQFIEFSPVGRASYPASFQSSLDVTWHGAVATFNSDPVYPTVGNAGLWVMVEAPPTVAVTTNG